MDLELISRTKKTSLGPGLGSGLNLGPGLGPSPGFHPSPGLGPGHGSGLGPSLGLGIGLPVTIKTMKPKAYVVVFVVILPHLFYYTKIQSSAHIIQFCAHVCQ